MSSQTNINDFTVLSQIGKFFSRIIFLLTYQQIIDKEFLSLGTGAFSEVFKVSRKTDGQEYALKKVSLPCRILS